MWCFFLWAWSEFDCERDGKMWVKDNCSGRREWVRHIGKWRQRVSRPTAFYLPLSLLDPCIAALPAGAERVQTFPHPLCRLRGDKSPPPKTSRHNSSLAHIGTSCSLHAFNISWVSSTCSRNKKIFSFFSLFFRWGWQIERKSETRDSCFLIQWQDEGAGGVSHNALGLPCSKCGCFVTLRLPQAAAKSAESRGKWWFIRFGWVH